MNLALPTRNEYEALLERVRRIEKTLYGHTIEGSVKEGDEEEEEDMPCRAPSQPRDIPYTQRAQLY
jgi:hypothetical protein